MGRLQEMPRIEINKAFIDAFPPGIDITIDSSAVAHQSVKSLV
jgi:hypothetical protein